MTHATQLMIGISLVTIPTIIYGGLTVLWIVTNGAAGTHGPPALTDMQKSLYRAGHAHAGVLMLFGLLLQLFIDVAQLGTLEWPARLAAPAAVVLVSGGFFGLAHARAMRWLVYGGAFALAACTIVVGVGMLGA